MEPQAEERSFEEILDELRSLPAGTADPERVVALVEEGCAASVRKHDRKLAEIRGVKR